ncbi:MAG: c-type cytochrome [Gemmataceae bacterium]
MNVALVRLGKHGLRGGLLLMLVCLTACGQQMGSSPAYKPLEPSDFFPDGRSSRPVVDGTVARGQLKTDTVLWEGRDAKGELTEVFPFEITDKVLERGKQRYEVFCSVCHGMTGQGDGRIVKRGFTVPPNYITDLSRGYKLRGQDKKLTDVPVGYIFEVITKGYGAMADHASQIPVPDRWAIAAYVRALQYNQSPEFREKMKSVLEKGDKK